MTNLSGNEWKDVRSTFSPIFTSGKMKSMLRFIHKVSERLVEEIDAKAEAGEMIELKDVCGKFSMDSIASCAFGVDAESFTSRESQFVQNASRIFTTTRLDAFKNSLLMIPGMRSLYGLIGINVFRPDQTRFFLNIIRKTISDRRASGVKRNDLVDMMMESMREGGLTVDESEQDDDQFEKDMKLAHNSKVKSFDELTMVATSLVLLVAGYDTTGMTLGYACHHLACNTDVQERLQDEIDAAYEESGGKVPDYNRIQDLPYLDSVIHETLRLHPPLGGVGRLSLNDYKIPGPCTIVAQNCLMYYQLGG